MNEEELLEKIKVNNGNGFNAIKLRANQVGMFNNFMMVAIEEAKKEVFDNVDKELNHTLHAFSKLMQEHKIHSGVQTKLLVPFMRFHGLIKRHLSTFQKVRSTK